VQRFATFVGDSVLIAHYVPFDLGAMTYALLRAGKGVPRMPRWTRPCCPSGCFRRAQPTRCRRSCTSRTAAGGGAPRAA
jgi:DNA polymerase III epsilon subunit-like protein